jgi:antitoxin component YwqK of YwqJK toxin-antitoxin module
MFRLVYLLAITALVAACNGTKDNNTSAGSTLKVDFKIDNAQELIDSTYKDGSRKVATYVDNETKERVALVKFHENGQPYTDLRFKNGAKNGISYSYYKDGKPWSMNEYRNDTLIGAYKTWHPNGQLYMDGFYKDGEPDGEFIKYFESGRIDTRGFYKNGKKTGVWTTYNKEGKLMREVDYDNSDSIKK